MATSPATRTLLRQLKLPVRLSETEQQEAALGLIRQFVGFAEQACGCSATSNRAHVRRAVFHATQHIELQALVTEGLGGDASAIESIARMECPVTVPDRTMTKVKVPESAPRRIIFASKALRKHFSLTETQTCRGCSKRSRCRFFKAPAQEGAAAGAGHVGRVLFGMSQYARAHLQQPDAFPFYFSPDNLRSAEVLLGAVAEQLRAEGQAPYGSSPLHSEIEVAEPQTAREMLLRDAKRKLAKRQKYLEAKVLSLPQWMRETLKPVPGPGMTERQRALLTESRKLAGEGSEAASSREPDDADEWMEEGAKPGELSGPLAFDPAPMDGPVRGMQTAEVDEATPITVVDGVKDLPVTRRFQHLPPKAKERPVVRFSEDHTGIYRLSDERTAHRIDLDQVGGDIDLAPESAPRSSLRGGYVIADLLGDEADNVPQEVLRHVSLPPQDLEGVQRYHSGGPPKQIDPRLLEELWRRDAEGQSELPFLQKIPFDSKLGRSGGSMPPAKLPHHLLVRGQEPVVAPPERGAPAFEAAASADGAAAAEADSSIVELDAPLGSQLDGHSEESLFAEENLVARAFARDGSERSRAVARADRQADADPGGAPDEESRLAERGRSPARGRPPPRPIGVLEPSVDFRRLGDPRHLDKVHVVEADSAVEFRQGKPLPRDEAFVSSFRRPLLAPSEDGEEPRDPLGSAAPGIDVEAIKAEHPPEAAAAAASAASGGLQQDSNYIIGGSIKFPKLPAAPKPAPQSAAASGLRGQKQPQIKGRAAAAQPQGGSAVAQPQATQRLPPRLGRLRQARIDTLQDLMRPGSPERAAPQALGEVAHPDAQGAGEGGAPLWLQRPRREADIREERNANIAMQRLLQQRLKASVQKRFPQPGQRPAQRDRGA